MEIIRITGQSQGSISEFYAREAENCRQSNMTVRAELLETMVSLLEYLSTSVQAPPVYGVTSHYRLRLVAADDYRSPTLVTIDPVIDGPKTLAFDIAYELPLPEAPWHDAWVHGLAVDVPDAAEKVLVALRRNAHIHRK